MSNAPLAFGRSPALRSKSRPVVAAALALSLAPLAAFGGAALAGNEKHANATEPQQAATTATAPAARHSGPAHWGYEGAAGPEAWARISADYAACGNGRAQSPIDFADSIPADLVDLEQSYRASALRILNNGHTVQVNYGAGSTLRIDGETYELLQFHFHSPSEHLVSGRPYPLEVHFVHKNAAGQLAVVGAFFERGEDNLALSEIWQHLPARQSDERKVTGTVINGADLLPQDRRYYRYMGSLTTPPCSEGVKWFVMKEPIAASDEQIRKFTSIFAMNARPVRPVNGRLVMGE